MLTARAENYLHGHPDLADTIARLQAYQEAGADVLYAPGLRSIEDIRQVIREVDRPVNVLAFDGVPTVAELAEAASAGSRWAARSHSPPWAHWPAPRPSCATRARTASRRAPPLVAPPPAVPSADFPERAVVRPSSPAPGPDSR